jgi:hypothetical protein
MMLAGATAAHTRRLRDVHAAPGDAAAYLRPVQQQQQQQQFYAAATSPERRTVPPPQQRVQQRQEAAAADSPAPHQWQLQAEAVVDAAGFEEAAAADPTGIVMGLPVAVAVACDGAAALPVAMKEQMPEAAAPDMQLQSQLAALKIKAAEIGRASGRERVSARV